MRRLIPLLISIAILEGFAFAPSSASSGVCTPRVLVLSAFPAEMDPLLSEAKLDAGGTITVEGRSFYVGRLRGNDVVLGLTGIGLVNAERTTKLALEQFRCGSKPGISSIVFSGVSGGRTSIGDVTVPRRWTLDKGKTWYGVDARMLTIAKRASRGVRFNQDTPLGDCACVGIDPDLIRTVHMEHVAQIIIGGSGTSSDPFGGRTFPCAPGGGDVFGCEPCRAPVHSPPDVARFVSGAVPFLDPDFFTGYFEEPPATPAGFDAVDMETAATARVAARNKIPFLAFRALSDGLDDPLMLGGFPAQFFVYRQLAADNAGAFALAFLGAWAQR